MAQQIFTRIVCDTCLNLAGKHEMATESVTIGGGKDARTLDLCHEHWRAAKLSDVVQAAQRWGRPYRPQDGRANTGTSPAVSKASTKSGKRVPRVGPDPTTERDGAAPANGQGAEVCPVCWEEQRSRDVWQRHMIAAHGMPGQRPSFSEFLTTYACPICNWPARRWQDVGHHTRRAHQSTASAAYAAARAAGDPHGVVASLRPLQAILDAPARTFAAPRPGRGVDDISARAQYAAAAHGWSDESPAAEGATS